MPYFNSDLGVLVKKGTKVDGPGMKSLRIGVYQGTTAATFVADVLKPAEPPKVYPNPSAMFAGVAAGQIDAAMADTSYVLGQVAKSGGSFEVVGQYSTGETYGAIYPKGSPNEAVFDKIILSLKADGTLDKLAEKYLADAWGADPTKIPYFKP